MNLMYWFSICLQALHNVRRDEGKELSIVDLKLAMACAVVLGAYEFLVEGPKMKLKEVES